MLSLQTMLTYLVCLASPVPESAPAVPAPSSPGEGKLDIPMESYDQVASPSDQRELVPSPLASTPDNRNIVRRKLTGYVGFANLPNQWHRKSVRKGFNFNVMVVGEYISSCCMGIALTSHASRR